LNKRKKALLSQGNFFGINLYKFDFKDLYSSNNGSYDLNFKNNSEDTFFIFINLILIYQIALIGLAGCYPAQPAKQSSINRLMWTINISFQGRHNEKTGINRRLLSGLWSWKWSTSHRPGDPSHPFRFRSPFHTPCTISRTDSYCPGAFWGFSHLARCFEMNGKMRKL
jgi:hypothetical protein